MEDRLPKRLRVGSRRRRAFEASDVDELLESSLEQRLADRLGELDRVTGDVELSVPPEPEGGPPRGRKVVPPDPAARAGQVQVVRGAWVAKYDPRRAVRESVLPAADRTVAQSDVFEDYRWGQPGLALREPWIHSWLMRGAGEGIEAMDVGDLVFPMRTAWHPADGGWLKRRTIVGLWFVESTTTWPELDEEGRIRWYSEAATFPLRRFDFPVPVEATADVDAAFDGVHAFHDRSRKALIELSAADALAVVRACGLPRSVLSERDPNRLVPLVAGLDLGPPSVVRRRILDGARAHAHRSAVEKAARDVAVGELRRARMGVVSTETQRGLGSDLWARGVEADGTVTQLRVEVKGLSGADPWLARLTWSEVDAARRDGGSGSWWLVIVTRALRPDRRQRWLSGPEAASVFTVEHADGTFTADRAAALRL